MSLQHWAIEAAWRNKAQRTVPGTSRHIILELHNNLVVTRDGVASFNHLLESCAKSLNSIVDLVNAQDPDILSKISLIQVPDKLPEMDDSFSRNSSSLSRSSHLSSDGPLKMELNYTQSERKPLHMESAPKESYELKASSPEVLPIVNTEAHPRPAVSSDPPVNHSLTQTQTAHLIEDSATEHQEEIVVKNDEATISVAASNESPVLMTNPVAKPKEPVQNTIPSSFSSTSLELKAPNNPKRATNGIAKSFRFQSSPKTAGSTTMLPHTSFLAEARNQLSNANGLAQRLRDGASSELEMSPVHVNPAAGPTTSPTANLSFIPIAKTINLNKLPTPTIQNTTTSDDDDDISFKAISTAIRKSFAGNASTARLTMSNTNQKQDSADFTMQPIKREPVTVKIEPNHQSLGSKTTNGATKLRRTLESSKRASVFVSLPEREPISFRSSMGHSIRVKKEDEAQLRNEGTQSQSDQPQISRHAQQEEPRTSTRKSSNATLNMHSTNLNKKENSFAKPNPSLQAPNSPNKNSASANGMNRTTANGSPRRVELPSLRAEFGPQAHRSKKRPSPELSRTSPTKRAWRSPTSETPQKHGVSVSSIRTKVPSPRRSPPKSYGTANASATRSKPSGIKNKFLVTKLNPDNPPTFVPSKVVQHKFSPKKTDSKAPLNSIPDFQIISVDLIKSTTVLKTEFNSASLLSNKLDLILSNFTNSATQPSLHMRSPKRSESKRDSKHKNNVSSIYGSHLSKVAPRRKAVGNAVPLPEAARGNFVRDLPKDKPDKPAMKDLKTPQRRFGNKSEIGTSIRYRSSPFLGRDELPDVPSDDEVLRQTKHLKSWADTPEIIRVLNEKPQPDPRAIFGEVPVLNIEDVFSSVSPSKSFEHS